MNGTGVSGTSNSPAGTFKAGVFGRSTHGPGVEGQSVNVPGVLGSSQNGVGVAGFSDNSAGVYAEGKGDSNSIGVFGRSDNGIAVRAFSANDIDTDWTNDQKGGAHYTLDEFLNTGATKITITGVLGGRTASETRVKNAGVYYIIRVK